MKIPALVLGLLLLAAPGTSQAQVPPAGPYVPCADLLGRLRDIRTAVDEVRLEDALSMSQGIEGDLACQQKVVSTLVLTSLYQTVGAVYQFTNDLATAELYFGRALTVSPAATMDQAFGPQAAEQFEQVRMRVMTQGPGTIQVDGVSGWADGRPIPAGMSLELAAGTHLVQARLHDGTFVTRTVRIGPDERYVVNLNGQVTRMVARTPGTPQPTASPEPVAAQPPPVAAPPASEGPRWALVGGGAAGVVLGSAFLVLAASNEAAFEATTDPNALSGLRTRTNAFSALGTGLASLGVVVVGTGFVLPVLQASSGGPALGAAVHLRW